jgi:hypothetical protein
MRHQLKPYREAKVVDGLIALALNVTPDSQQTDKQGRERQSSTHRNHLWLSPFAGAGWGRERALSTASLEQGQSD